MMGTAGHMGDQFTLSEDRRDQRDVGQMSTGDERIVDDDDVTFFQRRQLCERRADGLEHRAQMDRNMLRLGDQFRLGIEDGAGCIHALLDIGRKGGAFQHHPHFLRGRLQRVAQYFKADWIEIAHAATSTIRLPDA